LRGRETEGDFEAEGRYFFFSRDETDLWVKHDGNGSPIAGGIRIPISTMSGIHLP